MEYTIRNEFLEADISDLGAELISLRDRHGRSYLWDGDPKYWTGHALTLFPMIGRCREDRYLYNGMSFPMGLHGLAVETVFHAAESGEQHLVLEMTDTEATRARYPFAFCFKVKFELKLHTLSVQYTVENRDDRPMYFAIGGHPGFMLPLEDGIPFESHYIEFDTGAEPEKVCIVPGCMVTGDIEKPELQGNRLYLRHEMFQQSALIMRNAGYHAALCADGCGSRIELEFPQMAYLGLWHTVNTKANFICIEPWSSRPGAADRVEELTERTDMIRLEAQKQCSRTVSISLCGSRTD